MSKKALEIFGVFDRGTPNRERIVIQINEDFFIANHFIAVGLLNNYNELLPTNESLLWLGTGKILRGDLIYVYTGKGTPTSGSLGNTTNTYYTIHWGRDKTIFNLPELEPFLFEAVDISFERKKNESFLISN